MSQTLVRLVPFRKIARGDDNEILGPHPSAFKLREGEAYLSVNVREIADSDAGTALTKIKKCHRGKNLTVGAKAIYTQGEFLDISATFQDGLFLTLRGKPKDPSYAGLSGFPDECDYELEKLAYGVWNDWVASASL